MPANNPSFQVHLNSLTDFARELGTQLAGTAALLARLDAMATAALPFGAFGEADALAERHGGAVREFRGVLERARQALDFAEDVTGTVASSYQRVDHQVAAELFPLRPHGDRT
ncbi:hypothetical protein LX15_003008 [Streptoalloteichus tenebrarius]|uniref:Uncharacterized protein n=1 Tax=Streptoalloteichus tenebrarius (strain ATCC 17920 / DSM 40477 / JCM 4838 / CBS 697.72 / NBRC 16177 / NCIMB 11028 / NRRL B-12390 / A12253. 1 / ISP 5477) TaxID=1933 RepID=A0ABT1HUW1_STRSD|nr:hypothetical protein [Streptoalloteichus tenebrarius]MCP2259307.1 hypothetical protein [Streptoalloteichus tenebrarius]BFE99070.1 hypothetical protein GCM10020241_07460 [Streptoalloteichus tenebrarius]